MTTDKELARIEYWRPSMMLEELDRFMRGHSFDLDRMWPFAPMQKGYHVPAIDVKEENDKFVISADLPGMTKEDVSIEFGEGMIDITAKKVEENEETGEGFIRKERGSMFFHRRLILPENVDGDRIQAKLTDGVLTIDLPKVVEVQVPKKKVDVQ